MRGAMAGVNFPTTEELKELSARMRESIDRSAAEAARWPRELMSHELARVLLSEPNSPVATMGCGHLNSHSFPVKVGLLDNGHILVGDFHKRRTGNGGRVITRTIYGSPTPFDEPQYREHTVRTMVDDGGEKL